MPAASVAPDAPSATGHAPDVPSTAPEKPGGSPSLVLLHGFAQHASSWDEVAEALRGHGWRVRALELGELAEEGCSFAEVCSRIADAVREAAAEAASVSRFATPVILAGYSMGGRLALEAMRRAAASGAPLPVSALLLESAGLGAADERERDDLRARNAERAHRVLDEGVPAFMDWWADLPLFASQKRLPEQAQRRLREGRRDNAPASLAHQLAAWGQQEQALRDDTVAFLDALCAHGVAVGYLAGALDAKYAALAEQVRAAVPEALVRVVPDAGHNVHLENPEAFARFALQLAG